MYFDNDDDYDERIKYFIYDEGGPVVIMVVSSWSSWS